MKIIGIDPGFTKAGVGIIEVKNNTKGTNLNQLPVINESDELPNGFSKSRISKAENVQKGI